MLLVSQSILYIIIVCAVGIGTWVFFKKPTSIVHQSFFFLVLGISGWMSGIALLYTTHNFGFNTLALGGGLVAFFGMTLFSRVFPYGDKPRVRFYGLFLPILLGALLLPFNLYIQGIVIDKNGLVQPVNGILFPFYAALNFLYLIILPIYFYIRNYDRSSGKERMQMLYLGSGILFFVLCTIICDVLLPSFGIYELNILGPLSALVLIGVISYAIVRHQLMDIRVVIQRGLVFSALLVLILLLYLCLLYLSESFFDAYEEITTPVFAGIVMLVGIITIPSITKYFRRVTDRFFFKDRYDYASALENLSTVLNENVRLGEMIEQVLKSLTDILKLELIEFAHFSTNSTYALLKNLSESVHNPEAGVGLKLEVSARGRIVGVFYFAAKRSGDPFTAEDKRLLNTFSKQAAVAFEKAELYQELQRYSESLEDMVKARTQRLSEMQEQQRQLFDDISHALQTPLTVLKGGMELLRNQKESEEMKTLESMEHGVDDLSRLIKDILQLARIDSQPVEDDASKIQLSELVESVIEYVEVVCKQNDILVIQNIEPNLTVQGNQKEIEEVIINLLNNAVQYTAMCDQRKIAVILARRNSSIELVIQDTGVGIATDKIPYVFDRFYRTEDSKVTGHGLGLAIVKRIIEKHQGTVHAESVLGKGTRMVVRLPRLSADETSANTTNDTSVDAKQNLPLQE
jgi:signal transduction histidine kinase